MKDLFRGSPFDAYCVNSTPPTNVQLFRMAFFHLYMILDIPSLHVTTCLWRQPLVFMNENDA